MNNKNKKRVIRSFLNNKRLGWLPLALAISSTLIVIGMISVYFNKILEYVLKAAAKGLFNFNNSSFIFIAKIIVSLILLILLLKWTNKERKKFSYIAIPEERDLEEGSIEALILPISKPNTINNVQIENDGGLKKLTIQYKKPKEDNIPEKSDEIIEFKESEALSRIRKLLIPDKDEKDRNKAQKIFDNWEMPLISVYRNVAKEGKTGGLKQLWLIGSLDDYNNKGEKKEGSAKSLIKIINILFAFFENKFDIYLYREGEEEKKVFKVDFNNLYRLNDESFINKIAVDFNNVDSMNRIFKDIIDYIRKGGITEHKIAIDITGGQKPVSIAGAFATLKFKTKNIYVDTNHKPNIKMIDAIIETEQEL